MESLPSANIRQHKLDQQRKLIEVIFYIKISPLFFVSYLLIRGLFVVDWGDFFVDWFYLWIKILNCFVSDLLIEVIFYL